MAVPEATPDTVPAVTVATAVLPLLHVPPVVPSVSVAVVPVHILADDGEIASVPAIMVTAFVTEQLPIE
jgi:hypothetical protein